MATVTKLPKFEGKPLIEPGVIPVANFLTGDFGEAVLKEYQGKVQSDYQGNRNLNVLSYRDGVVQGSNPFAVVLMNQVLGQDDIHVARLADLEKILRIEALNLRGTYEDAALVLRDTNDPNYYLARNLQEQLKARGKVRYPVMVELADLDLVNNQEGQYKLSFKLREGAKVVHAKQLDYINNCKRFSKTDENGLPVFDNDGSRTLYTRNSGLSRLFLYRGLVLGSGWGNLVDSFQDGRVVILSGEATRPKRDIRFKN